MLCLALIAPLIAWAQRSASSEADGRAELSSQVLELPSFSSLVKRQGPTVVNISSTQTVRGVPRFPGSEREDPFSEFLWRFAPPESGGREFHVLTLEGHSADGVPLMQQVKRAGTRIADRLPNTAIREHAAASLAQLPEALRGLATAPAYIVQIAPCVQQLADEVDAYERAQSRGQ